MNNNGNQDLSTLHPLDQIHEELSCIVGNALWLAESTRDAESMYERVMVARVETPRFSCRDGIITIAPREGDECEEMKLSLTCGEWNERRDDPDPAVRRARDEHDLKTLRGVVVNGQTEPSQIPLTQTVGRIYETLIRIGQLLHIRDERCRDLLTLAESHLEDATSLIGELASGRIRNDLSALKRAYLTGQRENTLNVLPWLKQGVPAAMAGPIDRLKKWRDQVKDLPRKNLTPTVAVSPELRGLPEPIKAAASRPARTTPVVLWEGAEHNERNVWLARTRSAYLEAHGNVADALAALKADGDEVSRSTFYNHLDALDRAIPRWRESVQLSNSTGNLDGMRNVGTRGKSRDKVR